MKNLKFLLLAILAVAGSAQGAELRLNKINNKTVHQIEWEKLPLPGMLGKMRPVMIDRFGSSQPNMPLIPPTTLSFRNPNKPSQAVLVELKLVRRVLKGGPGFREDPKGREFTELYIILRDAEGTIVQRLSQRINQNFIYTLDVNLKGLSLQKTAVEIMGHEISTTGGGPRAVQTN